MKKFTRADWKWLVTIVVALIVMSLFIASVVSAGGGPETYNLPDGVQVYEVDGHVCVSDMRGGMQCWCRGECSSSIICQEPDSTFDSPLPTPVRPTWTPIPNKTVVPYITPTVPDVPPVGPTDTPVVPTRTTRPTPPAVTNTPGPNPTYTPEPTKTTRPTPPAYPTDTPVVPTKIVPTDTPVAPTNTPEPEPTDKPKCNQGRGNGSEGCSPGKSDNTVNPGHPKGPNDEPPGQGKRPDPERQCGLSDPDPCKGNDK